MSEARLVVGGTVRVPGDKSMSHRALMLAALSDGASRITGILDSADVRSTAGALRSLGVEVPDLASEIAVRGVGLGNLRESLAPLDCGNSGTTTRLMAGIVAAQAFTTRFIGDGSLSRRPMRRIAKPLEAMGARVELSEGGTLPMRVTGGALHSVDWKSETASAQVKSAVLLAALNGRVAASVTEPERSRDHTERMLRARGVDVREDGDTIHIAPVERLAALDVQVPGDPSSAAFFVALAALADDGEIRLEGVSTNPTRAGFFGVVREMGARVELENVREEGGEPVADLVVSAPGRALWNATVDRALVPSMIDEIPLLACLGARAEGETVITGAEELRVKESDRIAVVVQNLRALGVEAEELPDGLAVTGSYGPLRGNVRTHGDHRIAMAFGVLAALPDSDIRIDDRDCVAVSYPGFWSDLTRITS